MRRSVAVLAAAWSLPVLAQAADGPMLRPSRDVTVTYAVGSGEGSGQQTVRWQAASGRQRVDAPDGKAFLIADLKAKQIVEVRTATRELVRSPMRDSALTGGKADFRRLEAARFAGQGCTYWSVTPAPGTAGQPDDICVTDDGVMLAMRVGKVVSAHAVSVTYAPSDPALFALPTGYKEVGD